MDREQFHNAIKQQDLHILEVSSTPYPVYNKLVNDSQFNDYVFAKVYSERYKQPAYVAFGSPFELTFETMTRGMANQIAMYFLRELERIEAERAMNEAKQT